MRRQSLARGRRGALAAAVLLLLLLPGSVVAQEARTVSLGAGWNAVVYTGGPTAPGALPIAERVNTIAFWDAETQTYLTYKAGLPSPAQSLRAVASGMVLLPEMTQAASWQLPGASLNPTVSLSAGWNLVPWTGAAMRTDGALGDLGSRLLGAYRLNASRGFDSYLPNVPASFATLEWRRHLRRPLAAGLRGTADPLDAGPSHGGGRRWRELRRSSAADPLAGSNAVVFIQTSSGCGSGVVVGPTRILTAAHVVEGVSAATVGFSDGSTAQAQVSDFEGAIDVAALAVNSVPGSVTPLSWASSDEPAVGDDLWIWGSRVATCWASASSPR